MAIEFKPGQTVRLQVGGDTVDAKIASRKNLGAYGSGPSDLGLEDVDRKSVV